VTGVAAAPADLTGPASVREALALLHTALDFLNDATLAGLPAEVHAEALRELERAQSKHTVARSRVLAAFSAQDGQQADGAQSPRTWLVWQTRVTRAAAAGALGWARRLAAHPVIEAVLAAGDVSVSWAARLCEWSDRLPGHARDEADSILCQAAAAGAGLPDLAALAGELLARCAGPDGDAGDGFEDRYLRLGVTYAGAGRLEGDLTPGCVTAVSTVLEALGKKAGPEDTRTAGQRRHDALEEACQRLIGAGMLPARSGQPARLHVHMTLSQLRGMPGAGEAERAWAASQAALRPGWLAGPAAGAAACDATLTPVVTGHLDPAALDRLTQAFLASRQPPASPPAAGSDPPAPASDLPAAAARPPGASASTFPAPATDGPTAGTRATDTPATDIPADLPEPGWPAGGTQAPATQAPRAIGPGFPAPAPASRAWGRLRRALLALAVEAVSGPGGLAAQLRTTLLTATLGSQTGTGPGNRAETGLAAVSLPLDVGAATEIIPGYLRRAVMIRHPHCGFPGCGQPASVCDIHHVVPRCRGGPTALPNLLPLCRFHHLTVIHRWGWALRLNADGTTAATSPDGTRTWHSHSPPRRAA
jgi:Domain of unknown function (DUF222)